TAPSTATATTPPVETPTQPAAPATAPTATLEPTATTSPTAISEPTATPPPTSTPEPTVTPTPTVPAPTATQAASDAFITIQTADTDEKIVALTFDAGADRGYAEEILDTLQAEGIHATFGMTANWAEANPDLILRMVNEGHVLINHTETHRSWTGFSTGAPPLTSAERADELHATEAVVESIAGYDLRPYFRPPYGDYDDTVVADLKANGYSVNVMWTVDSLGWNGLSAPDITARVINGTVPGAIHLFHVGAASQDAAALPDIIAGLRDLGYRFVTIKEMVGR
ncbi:MAG TPA: polysaccharide deacetylase family protein, partial [Thermomicrobiales bacterium]|nr:polysaccharide deacetylase family protein [Thermomicrobiales bacterium]